MKIALSWPDKAAGPCSDLVMGFWFFVWYEVERVPNFFLGFVAESRLLRAARKVRRPASYFGLPEGLRDRRWVRRQWVQCRLCSCFLNGEDGEMIASK